MFCRLRRLISFIADKGIMWCFRRSAYSLKLRLLRTFPGLESVYEKKTKPVLRFDVFDLKVEDIKNFLNALSGAKREEIINEANLSSKGVIKGFSHVKLDYGFPINWHLNPLTGKEVDKNAKWYQIPDFNSEFGDIKIVWEISRFSHLFLFSRAFLLTENRKYYDSFSRQIDDWVINNRYSFGVNYKCGQECSIRMINVLLAASIFQPLLTQTDIDNIKTIIESSLKKVLSNFNYAYKCQKNNHALSEICGMIVGSYCTSDLRRLKRARRYLEKAIHEQFLPDGGYMQQSFVYQRLAFQTLEISLSVLKKCGLGIDAKSRELISNSALQMFQCMDSSGDMPNYGANDGSLIFPMHTGGYRDFRPTVNAIYCLLHNKKLFFDSACDEELLWLNLDLNVPIERIEKKSTAFYDSGLFTFRKNNYWLLLVAKKRSSHMDNGHIDVWTNGKNIMCDNGSYSYADPIGEKLSSTISHNTIYCDGMEQLNKFGKFAFFGQPKLTISNVTSSSIICFFRFKNGYNHKRTLTIEDNEFSVIDESNREFQTIFYTPFSIEKGNQTLRSESFVLCSPNTIESLKSCRSLYYLSLDEINRISINSKNKVTTTKVMIGGCKNG